MFIGAAIMDLMKKLESKIQFLIQQRNQFRDEVAMLKSEQASHRDELHALSLHLEDLQTECISLQVEKETLKKQIEAVLQMVDGLE